MGAGRPRRRSLNSAPTGEAVTRAAQNRWDLAEEMATRTIETAVSWLSFGQCSYTARPQTPRQREPRAYQSDEEIARGWIFRAFSASICAYADVVHAFDVRGLDRLPKDEPVLFILPHSTHNVDIFVCLFKMQQMCGRFPRGLFHRGVMLCWGWLLRFFGGVPGKRDIAVDLAKAGFNIACVPGGVEDILHHLTGNGRKAYELCWESHNHPGVLRKGFGSVACEVGEGFRIVPLFVENGEEMKCNVLFEVVTGLGLDVAYGSIMRKMPSPIAWLMWQIAIFTWCSLSFAALVVPVKVTAHIGEAIVVGKEETGEQVAGRAHQALQELIDQTQGRRHRSFRTGLALRLEHLRLQLACCFRAKSE